MLTNKRNFAQLPLLTENNDRPNSIIIIRNVTVIIICLRYYTYIIFEGDKLPKGKSTSTFYRKRHDTFQGKFANNVKFANM